MSQEDDTPSAADLQLAHLYEVTTGRAVMPTGNTEGRHRESRLEVAARTLVRVLEEMAGPEWRKDLNPVNAIDRAWLELWAAVEDVEFAAEGRPPAPLKLFDGESPSRRIETGEPGMQGLDVVFGKEAVGLLPVGFEPGVALSYKAAAMLHDVLGDNDEVMSQGGFDG